jgi:MerR family redox-sensitive transcriptional activator SoxR
VSRRSGHGASTLRYWETVGLLPAPPRVGGKREYPADVVERIAVIDLAREAGFSLDEIRELLDGIATGVPPGRQWAALVERKRPEVDELIARAQAMRRLLDELARCTCPTLEDCAVASQA